MALGPCGGFSVVNPYWGDERVVDAQILGENYEYLISSGLWPSKKLDQAKVYFHYGVEGDWVIQSPVDPIDIYRCAKSFFEATYKVEK
jgi:hypothetical protein